MRRVRLELYEIAIAAQVGLHRHLAAMRRGLQDKHGADSSADGWQLHIEGALGELAAAKALGVYWSGSVNTFKAVDIGVRLQVRTRSKHTYDLIIRRSDSDDDLYLLVTGSCPEYVVHGFIRGRDAKLRDDWIARHGGREAAWFVPKAALHALDDLAALTGN